MKCTFGFLRVFLLFSSSALAVAPPPGDREITRIAFLGDSITAGVGVKSPKTDR